MRLWIIGSQGQLGSELKKILNTQSSEIGVVPDIFKNVSVNSTNSTELDIKDREAVIAYAKNFKPDIIINCAAYTDVDGCETNKDDALRVNALGARNIAIAAEYIYAKLVHISTDYIFNGTGSKPYQEFDIPDPQSVYGASKYLGEQYVREFCSRNFIVRTSWLYGYSGKNFVKTIMKAGRERGSLKVVNDQIGNPTNAVDLAYHVLKIATTDEYGIYHCTGTGECSWFDFASMIIEYAGINATVLPCTTEEFPRPAKRPAYSSLDNMMLRCTVGDEMRSWQDALKCFIEKYDEN